jgi:hypothetical protein
MVYLWCTYGLRGSNVSSFDYMASNYEIGSMRQQTDGRTDTTKLTDAFQTRERV